MGCESYFFLTISNGARIAMKGVRWYLVMQTSYMHADKLYAYG